MTESSSFLRLLTSVRMLFSARRVFLVSLSLLIFIIGAGAAFLSAAEDTRPYRFIRDNIYLVGKRFLDTGMLAPAGLIETASPFAPAENIRATPEASGYRIVVAFDKKENLFLARLFDARGAVIRVWRIGDRRLSQTGWPKALFRPHGAAIAPDGRLFINSDADEALVAYDRCSQELWRRADVFHHQLTIDENGDLWSWRGKGRQISFDQFIERIDADTGMTLESISLIDDVVKPSARNRLILGLPETFDRNDKSFRNLAADVFHPNDVEPLPSAIADAFPQFAVGDLLVSFRNQNLVAVIDRKSKEIIWSRHGPWVRQHDPDFLPTGEISVFDNQHSDSPRPTTFRRRSRLIAVDPKTDELRSVLPQSTPPFYTPEMGAHQQYDDGRVLIVAAEEGRVLEIDLKSTKTLFEFNNRIDRRHSANVPMAIHLPEDFFDEKPENWTCP